MTTTRMQAIDKLITFHKAWEEGSIEKMTKAVGLTDELVALMSLDDIMESIAVRMSDLLKLANGDTQ